MTAQWFEAIGTVGAFVVGMVLLLLEVFDRHRHRIDRTRAQAVNVSAWCVSGGVDKHGGNVVTIAVQNRSNEPIYGVDAHVMSGDLADFVESIAVIVPPDTQQEFAIASPTTVRHDPMHWPTLLDLAFSDARGRRWVRRADGALELNGELRGSPREW